jgi:hypothetical protein
VAGGALPISAGTSFHGRRKPNGSACQRRTSRGSGMRRSTRSGRYRRSGGSRSPHQADHDTGICKPQRLAALLLFGSCHRERTGVAHVVPGGLDRAVGALDVRDAELIDMAVEGIQRCRSRARQRVEPWSRRDGSGMISFLQLRHQPRWRVASSARVSLAFEGRGSTIIPPPGTRPPSPRSPNARPRARPSRGRRRGCAAVRACGTPQADVGP